MSTTKTRTVRGIDALANFWEAEVDKNLPVP